MDHTLVIPTYNRPQFLTRLLGYYSERAPQLKLLVLDSSRPEIVEKNAHALAAYRGAIRHIGFPQTEPMVSKIARGLEEVATSYVSLCADDDIVFPDGLRAATAFLAENTDYVSAHGLYLNFRVADHQVYLEREYSGTGNEAEHPGARIFFLCQNYESLFYAAFRTTDLRQISAAASALPSLHFQELFQSVAALIKGKVKRFPKFYAGRQSCEPAEPTRDRWQTYYWFADDPAELIHHYSSYRNEIWRFYDAHAAAPRLSENEFCRVLDLAHAVYFSARCPPAYFHSTLQPFWPQEPCAAPASSDLLDAIRPASPQRRLRRGVRLLNLLRHRVRRRARERWTAELAELDRSMPRAGTTSWTCRLPNGLQWLATVPDFRQTYHELYRYLDRA